MGEERAERGGGRRKANMATETDWGETGRGRHHRHKGDEYSSAARSQGLDIVTSTEGRDCKTKAL